MIKIEKAESYRSCSHCYSKNDVMNITIRYQCTNTGTQITLCKECRESMVNEIRRVDAGKRGEETTEPTEKQVLYAKYLAQRMCQELPKEYTKDAYSNFISKWKPIVKYEDDGMNEPNSWQMQYM